MANKYKAVNVNVSGTHTTDVRNTNIKIPLQHGREGN